MPPCALNFKAGIPPYKLIPGQNGVFVRIACFAQTSSSELLKSHFAEHLLSQQLKTEVCVMCTVVHYLWPCILPLA